jgi:hypothetical protein
LASAIERFTGVCVLVLEANIGSFVLLQRAEWQLLTPACFAQKASTDCTLSSAAYCVSTSTSSP